MEIIVQLVKLQLKKTCLPYSFAKTLCVFFLVGCWSVFSYAQSIEVNSFDTRQSIIMLGGDMERSGANLQKAANKEIIIDWAIKDIPFNTWRVKYDKKQEMVEGNKDWDFYADDVLTMKMIKAANPDIKFFATLKSDYNGYSEDNHNNFPTFIYNYEYHPDGSESGNKVFNATKYGIFLADYIEFMAQSGLPISYLSTSKEYTQVVTAIRAKVAIETMQSELASRGVEMPLIVDTASWSLSQGVSSVSNYDAVNATQYVYAFSAHNYWSNENLTWLDFTLAANNAGKFAFADETGHGGGGLTTDEADINLLLSAYAERSTFYEQGIQGDVFFELWPRGYNEVNSNGFYAKPIFFDSGSNGTRLRSYYVMQKFVTETLGRKYVNVSKSNLPSVHTMAFGKNDEIALWVINQSDTTYNDLSLTVSNLGLRWGMDVQQTSWDETSDITGTKKLIRLNSTDSFNAQIKAKSISVFSVKPTFTLKPYAQINGGAWRSTQLVTLTEGDSVKFGPQSSVNGSWTWHGPNGLSAASREMTLSNMSPNMAGNYVATYHGANGYTNTLEMTALLSCNATPLTNPYHRINGGSWVRSSSVNIEAGDSVTFGPQPVSGGAWRWVGPNNFTSVSREIDVTRFTPEMAGNYVATYTNREGCSTNITYSVAVQCSSSPVIRPFFQVNNGAWSNNSSININTGDTLKFGPQSASNGTWSWEGPNEFKAMIVREIKIENIGSTSVGSFTATRTNVQGCSSTFTWDVSL